MPTGGQQLSGRQKVGEGKNFGQTKRAAAAIHKAYEKVTGIIANLGKSTSMRMQPLEKVKQKPVNPYHAVGTKLHKNQPVQKAKPILPVFGSRWETDYEWINDLPRKGNNTRLWLQNPNGISTYDNFRTFKGDLEQVRDYEIDFLGLPETKLNKNNKIVCERFKTIIESHLSNPHMCITNTTGYRNDVQYQPGGVASVAMNKLAGRFAGKGSDKLGRYTWMKFCGKKRTIKVYTFYRVSQTSGQNIGDTTAYVQQYNILNKIKMNVRKENNQNLDEDGKKHKIIDPRQQILEDMKKDITNDLLQNVLVILMGDLNEDIFNSKFNTTMSEMGIVNVLQNQNVLEKKIRSQNRGRKILDGIWMSAPLMDIHRQAGLAPFYDLITSDHRGIFLDLDLKNILDAPNIEFTQLRYRRLQSTIPKRAKAYMKELENQWSHRSLHKKIEQLQESHTTMGKEMLAEKLNKLDSQIGEIMTASEKKCTLVNKMAIHEWSPQLAQAIKNERDVQKRIAKSKRCEVTDNTTEVNELLKKLQEELKEAREALKKVKNEAAEYRQTHIDDLIQEHLDRNPKSTYAGELKRLQNVEKQRKDAQRIRRTHSTKRKGGIKSVYIPAPNSYASLDDQKNYMNIDVIWKRLQINNGKDVKQWQEISERALVEDLTLKCMMKHFGQANGTPLTSTKWDNMLVSDDFIQNIREENYEDIQNETMAIQEYFKAMNINKKQTPCQPKYVYSLEDWKWHIQHVKEKTSTSPAGRHYGHFKTILNHNPEIFEDMYHIMHIAFANGILLKRWKDTVTVLIPKDDGIIKIHRLRPLHLVEPEVNALAKGLWARTLMKRAERTNNMTDDQYGGRKNRQAQSAVLNKILYYDINRLSVTTAQYDDIDMKSNYDRELPRLVSAEARIKLGLHAHDANFMVQFTENQNFYVKTAYGVSEECYRYKPENKLFGLGQGIAWSGPGWLTSSDTIAKCKRGTCNGMLYESPYFGSIRVKKNQDMFVDDTGCGCNLATAERNVMQQAQINSQKHSDYVDVTGGMIAADKCHYYHVKWALQHGFQVPVFDENEQSELFLQQGDGRKRHIKKLQPNIEHKTLGCWVNPIGIQCKAYDQIRMFILNWKNRILHSSLPPHLVKQSYETELRSQIRYRMPVYMFDEKQCDTLMKIISPVLLHANYVNKNYPRSLMQANSQYGGLGITHIYDVMGIEKLKFLLMHIRRKDTTGDLLQISMQQTQLECGSEKLFFNLNHDEYGHLTTPTWNTNLWQYVSSRSINMELDLNVQIKNPRVNDKFIMDILMHDGNLTKQELIGVNKVRQHLELLTLSDIADLRGKNILRNIGEGKKERDSRYTFSRQEPPQKWINWWIKKACPILKKHLNKKPLGEWKTKPNQKWNWSHDVKANVIQRDGEIFKKNGRNVYLPQNGERETRNYRWNNWADVTFDRKGHPYIIASMSKDLMKPQEEKEKNFENEYGKIWGAVEYLEPKNIVLEKIVSGDVLIATDGSNWNDEGAQAWGVANKEGRFLLKGRGRVPCAKSDASSLRPELHALLAATTYVNAVYQDICNGNKKKSKRISVFTDSANAITDMKSSLYATTKNVLENNIDMKLELKQVLRTSLVPFNLIHVRAHQDEVKPYEELSIAEKMNCEIDKYAGQVYETSTQTHLEWVPFFKTQVCSLTLPFSRPTSNVQEQLTSFTNGHKAEKQLSTFWNVDEKWMCNIEWKGFRTALRRHKGETSGAMSKLVHKQWATMYMMKRNGMSATSKCPLCEEPVESWEHVLKCGCSVMRLTRSMQLQSLKRALGKKHTHPVLQQRIMAAILQWTQDFEVSMPPRDYHHDDINAAFRDQRILGIENMFCGIISHKFGDIQQSYYDQLQLDKKRLTKHEWNVTLIRELLKFSEAMWERRCKFVHEESELSMEMQTRSLAWKLQHMVRNSPWMIRHDDAHLLSRDRNFFQTGSIINVQSWVQRMQISMDIQENHEQATRQDIRKWVEGDNIGRRIIRYNNNLLPLKKYKQTKLPVYVNSATTHEDDQAFQYLPLEYESDSASMFLDNFQDEYELFFEDEEGWNMGLNSLQEDLNVTHDEQRCPSISLIATTNEQCYKQAHKKRSINRSEPHPSDSGTKRNDGHGPPIASERVSVPLLKVNEQYKRVNEQQEEGINMQQQQDSSKALINSSPCPPPRSENILKCAPNKFNLDVITNMNELQQGIVEGMNNVHNKNSWYKRILGTWRDKWPSTKSIDEESDDIVYGESSETGQCDERLQESIINEHSTTTSTISIPTCKDEAVSLTNVQKQTLSTSGRSQTMSFTRYCEKHCRKATRKISNIIWESRSLEDSLEDTPGPMNVERHITRRQEPFIHLEQLKLKGISMKALHQQQGQKPYQSTTNHKRSLIVRTLLEEEAQELRSDDDASASTVENAPMMALEEISDSEILDEARHEHDRKQRKELSTKSQPCTTYRWEQLAYCFENKKKRNLPIETSIKKDCGKMNLIRGCENLKISKVASSDLDGSCIAVRTNNERHIKLANRIQNKCDNGIQNENEDGMQNDNGNGIQNTIQKKYNVCVKKFFNKNNLGS